MATRKRNHSRFRIKKERLVSEESAIAIVQQFCERYDIDPEPVDGEVDENIEKTLDAITEYVSLGYLEFKDDFSIVQHLQYPPGEIKDVVYQKINGQQKRAMDGYGEKETYAKIYALMGAASGLGLEGIQKLKGIDLKVMEALGITFL